MFTRKQEGILRRMRPELAEAIRESFSSKARMHEAHMDMIPTSSVSGDQSVAPASSKVPEAEKE